MKTRRDIVYKFWDNVSVTIPKGTPAIRADNIPLGADDKPRYWVLAWDSLPEREYRRVEEMGCLLGAHEVEED